MKKIQALFLATLMVGIAIVPIVAGNVPIEIREGSPHTYNTAATVVGAGGDCPGPAPLIKAVWITPDEDNTTMGTQVFPTASGNKTITVYAVVHYPARDSISQVFVDIYFPNGTKKFHPGFNMNKVADTTEIENALSNAVTKELGYVNVEYYSAKDPDTNDDLFPWYDGHNAPITQNIKEEIKTEIFQKETAYLYKVSIDLDYCEEAGTYKVRVFATHTSGNPSSDFFAYYYWIPTAIIHTDFDHLNWGDITTNEWYTIMGDENMNTPSKPTIKNEGNIRVKIGVSSTRMEDTSKQHYITKFDVKFRGYRREYSPDHTVWFSSTDQQLELCHMRQIDFSVHAPEGIPKGTYTGTLTIYVQAGTYENFEWNWDPHFNF